MGSPWEAVNLGLRSRGGLKLGSKSQGLIGAMKRGPQFSFSKGKLAKDSFGFFCLVGLEMKESYR